MAHIDEDAAQHSSFPLIKRLYHDYIHTHLPQIAIAAACMIVAAIATGGQAYLIKPMLDEIFVRQNQEMLALIPLAILGISLVKGVASYAHALIMKCVGQRITTAMQMRMYGHLLYSDITTFARSSSGNMISRFTNDIHIIRKNMTQALVGMIKELVTLLALVTVMFIVNWKLALIAFVVFPIAVWPILKLGRRMRKVSHTTQEEMEQFTAHLDDTFQGVRVVKAYGNEEHEISRAKAIIDRLLGLYIKAAKIESIASPMMEGLAGIAIAAVVFYGGMQVLDGATTPGAFFSFIGAFLMAYKPMKTLSGLNTTMQEGLAAVRRLFAMLDIEPAITDKDNAMELELDKVEIVFEDVHFSYGKDNKALQGVSFTVPKGQRVALVGASGGGKSTIMNMIQRFYDPDEGVIRVGGEDIRDVTQASLRQHIAVVNQEATLFDDTIRNNIAYGKLGATEEEIIDAAKAAAAHDFIIEQPQGYDTMIGQHGVRLSGGQRQRIAIARAMLRDAPILLLDEATSALDTVSEKQVQGALQTLMHNRTTLVIAHRLSTVMDADMIYVVDQGQIIESGTHDALLKQGGAYKTLYDHQFAGQTDKRRGITPASVSHQ